LTQEQLADALMVDRSTVVRWERAETEPHPSIRPMIALRLGVTLDELDDLLSYKAMVGHRRMRRREPGHDEGNDRSAHEVASSFAILGIDQQFASIDQSGIDRINEDQAGIDQVATDHVGADHVALLEVAIHNIERRDAARGGDAVYGSAQCLRRVADGWLDQGSPPPEVRNGIQSLVADLDWWLGWLAFDADRRDQALRYLQEALLSARLIDDPFLEVRTMASLSLLALDVRPREALQCAQAAQRLAGGWITPRLAALLHLRAARAHAALTDERAFAREIAKAAAQLDRGPGPDEPLFVQFVGPGELSGITGLSYLAMRRPDRASALFRDIVDNPDPAYGRNVSYYTVRLAESLGRQGDISGACTVARQAVNLVAGLESTRTTRFLGQFRRAVAPHLAASAEARDFADAYDDVYGHDMCANGS
jgi:transcriptional regulator with XRE-family HTH domain